VFNIHQDRGQSSCWGSGWCWGKTAVWFDPTHHEWKSCMRQGANKVERSLQPMFPPFLDLAGIFLLSCRISASSSLSPLMYITLCLITFVSRYGDNIARSEPLITERVRQAWDHNLIQRCPVPSLGPSCPPNLKLDSSLGIPRTYRTYSTIGY